MNDKSPFAVVLVAIETAMPPGRSADEMDDDEVLVVGDLIKAVVEAHGWDVNDYYAECLRRLNEDR